MHLLCAEVEYCASYVRHSVAIFCLNSDDLRSVRSMRRAFRYRAIARLGTPLFVFEMGADISNAALTTMPELVPKRFRCLHRCNDRTNTTMTRQQFGTGIEVTKFQLVIDLAVTSVPCWCVASCCFHDPATVSFTEASSLLNPLRTPFRTSNQLEKAVVDFPCGIGLDGSCFILHRACWSLFAHEFISSNSYRLKPHPSPY